MFDGVVAGGADRGTGAESAAVPGVFGLRVAGLAEALDRLVDIESGGLSDGELADAMVALRREQARLAAVVAELTAVFEARQVHAGDGARTATDWIAVRARIPRAQAGREVRHARLLRAMPATRTAFEAGDINPAHVGGAVPPGRPSPRRTPLPRGHDGWMVRTSTPSETVVGWELDAPRSAWVALTIPPALADQTEEILAALTPA